MGNFYCIDSSCAEVHYREYLSPVVRWRYPDEQNWNEIEADDYSIDDGSAKYGTEQGGWYKIYGKAVTLGGQVISVFLLNNFTGAIYDFKLIPYGEIVYGQITWTQFTGCNAISCQCTKITNSWALYASYNGGTITCRYVPKEGYTIQPVISLNSLHDVYVEKFPNDYYGSRFCRNNVIEECVFTVYKNGEIVYQNIREDCPEVEQLPCRLSNEFKQIKVDKLPYLDRVEVVNYEIIKLLLNVFRGQIPDECLNIYLNNTTGIIPLPGGVPLPYTYTSWQLIAQICSKPGCPPPEYQVICNCNCDTCPPNTCAVECEGHICCYDEQGIAVKQITLEDYCEI